MGGGDDAYDWATEGNTDTIPLAKFPMTPAPVPMRIAWGTTRIFTETQFTAAGGAAIGMSDSLAVPPIPTALQSESSLYLGIWFPNTAPDPVRIEELDFFFARPNGFLSQFR